MSQEVYTLQTLEQNALLSSEGDLYAIIGSPIAHSLSPVLQQAAFEHYQLKAQYIRVEVKLEELEKAVQLFKRKGFKGFNVTLPHKVRIMEYLDEVSPSARLLGAVNTVALRENKYVGYNTDGPGWVRAVRQMFGLDLRDLRVMVLGMGGAGEALATQAALEGCERLILVNRAFEKAQILVEKLKPYFKPQKLLGAHDSLVALSWDEKHIQEEIENVDLIVHCTPLGLTVGDPSPLPAHILQPHLLIYDTIYNPAVTSLMREARLAGARAENGLSMLIHQGALAFEIWTGREAPIEKMSNAVRPHA